MAQPLYTPLAPRNPPHSLPARIVPGIVPSRGADGWMKVCPAKEMGHLGSSRVVSHHASTFSATCCRVGILTAHCHAPHSSSRATLTPQTNTPSSLLALTNATTLYGQSCRDLRGSVPPSQPQTTVSGPHTGFDAQPQKKSRARDLRVDFKRDYFVGP